MSRPRGGHRRFDEPAPSPAGPLPVVHRYVRAEVKCLLCGTAAGTLQRDSASRQPWFGFQATAASPSVPVRDTGHIRCPRCGGRVYTDEVEVVEIREDTAEWPDETPRRGRPPRWLVAQRLRLKEDQQRPR